MYKKHCDNLKFLTYSLKELEKQTKNSLKTENELATTLNTNLHSFLTGAWIEVSLYKLIYENKFDSIDREIIIPNSNTSLERKWKNALDLAFSKAFSDNFSLQEINSTIFLSKLTDTQLQWYTNIQDFINNDLKDVVSLRNKIAHGQWKHTFNSNMSRVNIDLQREIKNNHYFISKRRLETVKVLVNMINDISMSPKTFARDFDKHYHEILIIKDRYNDIAFKENVENMKAKFNRAVAWETHNRNRK
ncbi:hypothetical protein [Planococcus donghaensis]|uniref:hypothetical protein n=1 Tax=Planococcus donghaensis TaxID=414778 RepID=UPI003734FB41